MNEATYRRSSESPAELERDVDETRAQLGRTVDELSNRLSPGELLDQALGFAREHGGEFGRNLGAEIKHNPLPLVLTSVGVTWMMASANGSSHLQSGADGAGHAGDGVAEAARSAAGKAGALTSSTGDRIKEASASARDSAYSAQQSMQDLLHEQPLLAGSLGVALGAALGALVPPSETEDDLMGGASDRAADRAKMAASEKYDEVRAGEQHSD